MRSAILTTHFGSPNLFVVGTTTPVALGLPHCDFAVLQYCTELVAAELAKCETLLEFALVGVRYHINQSAIHQREGVLIGHFFLGRFVAVPERSIARATSSMTNFRSAWRCCPRVSAVSGGAPLPRAFNASYIVAFGAG